MNGSVDILAWLQGNVEMHEKRRATLALCVGAAMALRGLGVLALGRSLAGRTSAKHGIKRVWRFLRNSAVELDAVSRALLRQMAPASGPLVVLADWTDLHPHTQLVFALPRDGRALAFLSYTIAHDGGEGSRVRAEEHALERLARIVEPGREVILVADRGFATPHWLNAIERRGWYYVQRFPRQVIVEVEEYTGALHELRLRRGTRAKDFGCGTIGQERPRTARLVACYGTEAKEPWLLVTNLSTALPIHIVRLYARRMWIEQMFRDWKNRQWGMGLDAVRLSQPERHDRLFLILALAYYFLSACGAYAERNGLAQDLKANTVTTRVMTLLRIGRQLLNRRRTIPNAALHALDWLPS
jgi:hypothetical protein